MHIRVYMSTYTCVSRFFFLCIENREVTLIPLILTHHCGVHGGFLWLWREGATLQTRCPVLLRWLLSLQSAGSRVRGLPLLQHAGSVLVAHGYCSLYHVESSRTRDLTQVPCSGRWILNHWTTREVQPSLFLLFPCLPS